MQRPPAHRNSPSPHTTPQSGSTQMGSVRQSDNRQSTITETILAHSALQSTSWLSQRPGSSWKTLPLQPPSPLPTLYTLRPSGEVGNRTPHLPKVSYQVLPLEHLTRSALELHAVSVTLSIKLNIALIYQPPGPLCDFFYEMDALLSCFSEDGIPLVILGDFNILPEKLQLQLQMNF